VSTVSTRSQRVPLRLGGRRAARTDPGRGPARAGAPTSRHPTGAGGAATARPAAAARSSHPRSGRHLDRRETARRSAGGVPVLEHLDGGAPGPFLRIVDLPQIEDVTLDHAAIGQAPVLHQAPVPVLLAFFLRVVQRRNMMGANYAHPARHEKGVGLHHSHFWAKPEGTPQRNQ